MVTGLVEGGIVGALMGKLQTSLTDMTTKYIRFESKLGDVTEILRSIEPKVLEIEKHNNELGCAAKTKPHIDLLNKGKELVEKCSEISPLSFIGRSRYSDELTGYEAALLSFCQVELQLEQSSDIKEMLVKLDRLDRISEVVKDRALFSPSLHPVIVPYSTLLKWKDEVLIKDRPAAVLLAPCWIGTATSPEIQEYFERMMQSSKYNKKWDEGTSGSGEGEESNPKKHEGAVGYGEGEEPNPKKHERTLGSGEGDEPSPKKPRKHRCA